MLAISITLQRARSYQIIGGADSLKCQSHFAAVFHSIRIGPRLSLNVIFKLFFLMTPHLVRITQTADKRSHFFFLLTEEVSR